MTPHLLSSPGGKCRGKKIIKKFVPRHWTTIQAPFLGAGHVERDCAETGIQVYGSDINALLVNFFQEVLRRPDRVADLIELYTPLIRNRAIYRRVSENLAFIRRTDDRAALFHIISHLSYGAVTERGRYNRVKHNEYLQGFHRFVQAIRQFRCPTLTVDCLDYRDALAIRDSVPAYLDPPYDTPASSALYGVQFDHEALFQVLRQREQWLCSYNPSPRILQLYEDFRIIDLRGAWWHSLNKRRASEILILSHDIVVPDGEWSFIRNE